MIKDSDLSPSSIGLKRPKRRLLAPMDMVGMPLRQWLGLTILTGASLGGLLVFLESENRELYTLNAQATQTLIMKERRQQASLLVEQTLGVIASRHRDYEHRLQRMLMTIMRAPFLGISHLSGRDRSFISTELLRQFPDLRINPDWISIEQLPTTLLPTWWSPELTLRLQSNERKPQFMRGSDTGLVFAIPIQHGSDASGEVRRQRIPASASWTLVHIDPKMVAFLVSSELRQSLHASLSEKARHYVWINEIIDPAGGRSYARRLIHPLLPDTEGELLSTQYRDATGRYPYQTELEGVLSGRGIFFDYHFPKAPGATPEEKTAYAALYPPFHWIVASGVYLDDINTAAFQAHEASMEKKHTLERWHFLITLAVTLLLCVSIGYTLLRQLRTRQRLMRRRMNFLERKLEQQGEDRLVTALKIIRNERCPERVGDELIVAKYVTDIATGLALDNEEISALARVALLYDLGKLALPDALLKPRHQLHFDQSQLLRQHIAIGSRLMADALMAPHEADLLSASQQYMPSMSTSSCEKLSPTTPGPGILALVVQIVEQVRHSHLTAAEAISEVEHRPQQPFSAEVLQMTRKVLAEQPIPPADATRHRLMPLQIERFASHWRDHATGCFNRRLLDASLEARLENGQPTLARRISLYHLQLRTPNDAAVLDQQFGPQLNACFYPLQVFHLATGHFLVLNSENFREAEAPHSSADIHQSSLAQPASDTAREPLSRLSQEKLHAQLLSLDGAAHLDITMHPLSCPQSLKEWQAVIDSLIHTQV